MKKGYLILLLILLLSIISYYWLGGFKSIEKSIVNNPIIDIYGIYYEGTIGSDSLQSLFMQSREIVEKNEGISAVAIVYYGETNEETGAVQNFIGVQLNDKDTLALPSNWEIRSFQSTRSVVGCIEANVLAMPTPADMLEELKSFAMQESITVDSIFIEYYAGPNNLCVELLGI